MADDRNPMRERNPIRGDEEAGRSSEEEFIGQTDDEDLEDLDEMEDDEDLEA
jgi:hypothetical protein